MKQTDRLIFTVNSEINNLGGDTKKDGKNSFRLRLFLQQISLKLIRGLRDVWGGNNPIRLDVFHHADPATGTTMRSCSVPPRPIETTRTDVLTSS